MKMAVRWSIIGFGIAMAFLITWLVIFYHEAEGGWPSTFAAFNRQDNRLTQGTYPTI